LLSRRISQRVADRKQQR